MPAQNQTAPQLRLGDTAPDFTAPSTHGSLTLSNYIQNSWAMLFSHPEDFTPVCTTELGELARLAPEFARRGVKLVGLSVDPVRRHLDWIADIEALAGAKVTFPIIDDSSRVVSARYGMLDQAAHDPTNLDAAGMPFTVRSVFVIDPARRVRLITTYPASCGRNMAELLRCIDSLQLSDARGVTTPVNWQPGERVIVHPQTSLAEARKKFTSVEEVRPYLRYAEL